LRGARFAGSSRKARRAKKCVCGRETRLCGRAETQICGCAGDAEAEDRGGGRAKKRLKGVRGDFAGKRHCGNKRKRALNGRDGQRTQRGKIGKERGRTVRPRLGSNDGTKGRKAGSEGWPPLQKEASWKAGLLRRKRRMDNFGIRAGRRCGERVAISGAKNSGAAGGWAAGFADVRKSGRLHKHFPGARLDYHEQLLASWTARVTINEFRAAINVIETPKLNHNEAAL